jgi:hypothetical protein
MFFACRIVVHAPHAIVVGAALLYRQYYLGFNIEQPVNPVGPNGKEIWLIYYPCYWYNNLYPTSHRNHAPVLSCVANASSFAAGKYAMVTAVRLHQARHLDG